MTNFLNVVQAADRLAVDRRTILRWIEDGSLAAIKAGDYRRAPYVIPADEVERLKVERDQKRTAQS